jgi:hypothetical protein
MHQVESFVELPFTQKGFYTMRVDRSHLGPEPIKVLLRPFFCPIARPARALEWIKTQVGDIRHVRMGLFAEPALWLIDEAEFVIVNAHRPDCAFAEVEDLMTDGRAFAGNSS